MGRVLPLLAAVAMGCGTPGGGAVDVAGEPGAATESSIDLTAIRPFEINVPDEVLEDLEARLAWTRLPGQIENSGWDYGTPVGYLTELITYLNHRKREVGRGPTVKLYHVVSNLNAHEFDAMYQLAEKTGSEAVEFTATAEAADSVAAPRDESGESEPPLQATTSIRAGPVHIRRISLRETKRALWQTSSD